MTKVCLLDNDIIHKLIALQLFDEAISVLQLATTDLRVLPTAKFVFQRKRKQNIQYPDEIWAKVIHLVEACSTLSDPSPEQAEASAIETKQLERFRNEIQVGEAALIVATRLEPNFLLVSGDKRCMKGLAAIPQPIYQRLCGRMICLEQIILKLISELGFEAVRDRVLPMVDCDKTLKICFGYSMPAIEESVISGLTSYINEIHKYAPALLMALELI